MDKLRFLLLAAWLLVASSAAAADGIDCRLDIYQRDLQDNQNVLLVSDSLTLVKGVVASGFVGPVSIEVDLTGVDSLRAEFSLHLLTLGPPTNNYARSFVVEYELPARMDNIKGKADAEYSVVLTPLKRVDVDTSFCGYDHRSRGTFDFTPAGYMDIHFVPLSLGDFYWDSIKDLLESFYRRFLDFGHFSLPGKIQVYICPCPLYSVIWDERFGIAVDPTRNTAFSLYSHDLNTTDQYIVNHVAVMRNFGYSPPLLSEGFANYFGFTAPDMKDILAAGRAPHLSDMLDTYAYMTLDPHTADRSSATFVRFMIDQYSLGQFLKLYEAADDLNLSEKIEQVYSMSIEELDGLWKNYVDTITIEPEMYARYANIAEQTLNYNLFLKYSRAFLDNAATRPDSLRALGLVKRAYFFTGDYYRATDIERTMLAIDSTAAMEWMALGTYLMMNGYYAEAYTNLAHAKSLDTASQVIDFNIALYHMCQDDTATAAQILTDNLSGEKGAMAQGETRVVLANIYKTSDDKNKRELAERYYREAMSGFQQTLQVHSSSPSLYMWLGIAQFGLDDPEAAVRDFETALFLETRPFYLGMINLWQGKAYLAAGHEAQARECFSAVLNQASADYHQREARQFLK
ncbi:MAG: hypothetical protein KAU36_05975 [candidate division Zixibacteria bacterium]|nr:hypothetical protein [candidate division Zixibacteria bacterium]